MNKAIERRAQDLVETVNRSPGDANERMALLAEAFEAAGVYELPDNRGPWVRLFMRGDEMAWCAGFLLWMAKAVYAPLPWAPRSVLRYWQNRAVSMWHKNAIRGGTWIGAAVVPQRGDAILYSTRNGSDRGPGSHVDLIVDVKQTPGRTVLVVIGGNVSNRVQKRLVALGDPLILGFHRWVEPTP